MFYWKFYHMSVEEFNKWYFYELFHGFVLFPPGQIIRSIWPFNGFFFFNRTFLVCTLLHRHRWYSTNEMSIWQHNVRNLKLKRFLYWTTYKVVIQGTCNIIYISVYFTEIEAYTASKLRIRNIHLLGTFCLSSQTYSSVYLDSDKQLVYCLISILLFFKSDI